MLPNKFTVEFKPIDIKAIDYLIHEHELIQQPIKTQGLNVMRTYKHDNKDYYELMTHMRIDKRKLNKGQIEFKSTKQTRVHKGLMNQFAIDSINELSNNFTSITTPVHEDNKDDNS